MLATTYTQLFALLYIGATIAWIKYSDAGLSDSSIFATALSLTSCWLCGIYVSLIVYRSFLHPLNKFPGPWQARVTDLWLCSKLTGLDAYTLLHDLHREYGHYVRVGSNTLSIADPEIMQPAYGARAVATKSDFYDAAAPHHSMQTTRDKGLHDRRRRVWAPAFSDRAIREYESAVAEMNEAVTARIDKGGSINVQLLFNLYSFDVMGRLAFGKDYEMIRSGERPRALEILTEGMKLAGLRLPTWLIRMLFAVPGAARAQDKFLKFCTNELKRRVEDGKGSRNDITGWLLKAYTNEDHPADDPYLQGDSRLIIVAGSDTTAAALTFLFYHLAKDPKQQTKLRDELRPFTRGEWSDKDIKCVQYLSGAINETLRLHPPVPLGLRRKAPREGLQVGETVIPGNTTFFAPQYVMGRGMYDRDTERNLTDRAQMSKSIHMQSYSSQSDGFLDPDLYSTRMHLRLSRWAHLAA